MNPDTLKTSAILLFAATYVALLVFPRIRAYIAVGVAALFVFLGIVPIRQLFGMINWNVLMMIAGTMGIVHFFIESKMPALLADLIIAKTPNVKWAIISLSLLAGIISAFVDNVATVLMIAPIALNISKKLRMSPVPAIIAIAISSNLQGAATLVGDATSILLGGYVGLNFMDFFFLKGRIGMFWIVQAGALAATLVLLWFLRKEAQAVRSASTTRVTDYFPTVMLVGTILMLIFASFFPNSWDIKNGLICISVFIIGLVREYSVKKSFKPVMRALGEVDLFTLLLLAGLFVIVGGITNLGIISDISEVFKKISDNVFVIYTLIVWGSVLLSAFIDNIPYIYAMLPVVETLSLSMGWPEQTRYLLYFGLLVGATLGGNLTPIGASANIAGIGILKKNGYDVKAKTFMAMSVPFTLAAVTTGYVLVWMIWS